MRDYENNIGLAQRTRDAALADLNLNDPSTQAYKDRASLLQGNVNRGVAGALVQQDLTAYDTGNANKQAADQSAYTDAVNKAGSDFSNTVGGLAAKGIEQGMTTGQDQASQQFLQSEAAKYPQLADKILGSGNLTTNNPSNGGV